MILLKLILTNLSRHRIRSFISIAGIAFSVAAMLTIVTVLQGAVGMFSGILSSDSQIIVFERNVSDLFFSDVAPSALKEIANWPMVQHADPVLFGIVSSADHPIITCFGVTEADARIRKATWIKGDRTDFGKHDDDVVLGERAADFLATTVGSHVQIGHGTFHVIGVLHTANGFEDGGVFMPLRSAQSFFHKDGSSVITIKLRSKDEIAAFKSAVKSKFPEPNCARGPGVHAFLFAVQDPQGNCVGGRRMRTSAGRAGRGEHDDHVGFHADSRDCHSSRQRLLERTDCGDDLRGVGAGSRRRRLHRTADRHILSPRPATHSGLARICRRNHSAARGPYRHRAGVVDWRGRSPLPGGLRHADSRGGGASIRMNNLSPITEWFGARGASGRAGLEELRRGFDHGAEGRRLRSGRRPHGCAVRAFRLREKHAAAPAGRIGRGRSAGASR